MSVGHQQSLQAVLAWLPIRRDTLLWSGLFVELVGIVADAYWHYVLGIHEVGTIPLPHWITIIGMLVALLGTVDSWYARDGFEMRLYTLGVVAGLVQLLGAVWDNWLHLAGVEPAPWALPHTLYRSGFGVLVVVAVAAVMARVVQTRVLTSTS